MNAIGYTRISTVDQSAYSLEYQQRIIAEYCTRHNLTLINTFTDDGESSYTFDRPDWQKLESFIKQNKNVQYLIISEHDRLSRNLAEALIKIKELHDKFKIKVLATSDNFDTDFSDPSTFLLRAFKYMMAESELHRIRQRTKTGLTQAALNGRHVNRAPYGYVNARDEQGKPIIVMDEEKGFLVRSIFKEYLNGNSIEEVKRIVKVLGYKQGGRSAIQRILNNPLYAGMIKIPGQKKMIKGLHTALITEQQYWLVQERLNDKHIVTQNREEVPLRGVLRCFCGKPVTAGNSRGKSGKYYWYYLCKEHRKNLSAVLLHKQFHEILDSLSLDPGTIEIIKQMLSDKIKVFLSEKINNLDRVNKDIKIVQSKIEKAEQKYLDSEEISEKSYKKVIGELKGKEQSLQHELSELNFNQQAYWDRLNTLLPKLSNLKQHYDALPLHKKHLFIDVIFDRQLYHDGKIFRTPYLNSIFKCKELILKEKGLLKIDSPVIVLGISPNRSENGTLFENLNELCEIFAAVG